MEPVANRLYVSAVYAQHHALLLLLAGVEPVANRLYVSAVYAQDHALLLRNVSRRGRRRMSAIVMTNSSRPIITAAKMIAICMI